MFSCTVLFVSISQVIGYEDRLRNDLYCVEWGVKLYSNQTKPNIKSRTETTGPVRTQSATSVAQVDKERATPFIHTVG